MKNGPLPCMLKGPEPIEPMQGTTGFMRLPQCHETAVGNELLEILQRRIVNFKDSTDALGRLIGPVDELDKAVSSSQALRDRLNVGRGASIR